MNWIVSLADPTGACDVAPSPTGNVVQSKSSAEGTQNVTLAATPSTGNTLVFTGLGRVSSAGFTQLDFSYPSGGTCQSAGGNMRCMRILVTTSGAAKICDPKVTDSTDPRYCS
jgi:type IV fimbrial biogenesis protein FimT